MITTKDILEQSNALKPPKVGDMVEGRVILKKAFAIYLDIGIFGTGVIYGKEFKKAKKELKNLQIGDKVLAKIVDLDNEEGFVELSVAGAAKEIALEELRKIKEDGKIIKVKITGANKGGLLTNVLGVDAFLPFSQLSPRYYKDENVKEGLEYRGTNSETSRLDILEKVKNLIGTELEVKILGILERGSQVILSEKLVSEEKEILKYKVGDVLETEVSGLTELGIFLKFGEGLEGLLPISEISDNLSFKLGDKVRAKIVSIGEGKILFSLKI